MLKTEDEIPCLAQIFRELCHSGIFLEADYNIGALGLLRCPFNTLRSKKALEVLVRLQGVLDSGGAWSFQGLDQPLKFLPWTQGSEVCTWGIRLQHFHWRAFSVLRLSCLHSLECWQIVATKKIEEQCKFPKSKANDSSIFTVNNKRNITIFIWKTYRADDNEQWQLLGPYCIMFWGNDSLLIDFRRTLIKASNVISNNLLDHNTFSHSKHLITCQISLLNGKGDTSQKNANLLPMSMVSISSHFAYNYNILVSFMKNITAMKYLLFALENTFRKQSLSYPSSETTGKHGTYTEM